MLKTRFITAFALGLPAMWLVFQSSEIVFWWFLFALVSLGMWEWTRLAGINALLPRIVLTLGFSILMYWLSIFNIEKYLGSLQPVFIFLTLWWIVAIQRVISSPGNTVTITPIKRVFRYIEGCIILTGLLLSLQLLHSQSTGPWLVLILLFLIWGADSFAYFTGRQWGNAKLLPRVSPGKTWAGVMGGLIGGTIVSSSIVFFHHLLNPFLLMMIPVIVVSIAFSVMGDLFESMYKRQVNLKDSSHLLPGHGGILDRIDSLLAAAPVFVSGLYLVGVIE